jgi:DNA-binding transcriptional regulator YdaS (Cro superfamily)
MKNNFKPRSKFEKWVRKFGGTKAVADALGVNQTSVQHWCAGRARPRLEASSKILSLSKGELTLADIVRGTKK